MEQNKSLTLGSLFDGSGGFPLGGLLCGITPVWASEVEPFPIRVTTKRLPFMKHYGDVSAMDGGKVEPVDIITFGSPCQDMSIAGKRAGLEGSRSNLFYQAVRIIKEMRCATNGKYPRWVCWENVPGAFSSNGGTDFKAVLDSLIGVICEDAEVPMPEKGQWPHADIYMGDGWSIAYRTLDAQYWGVPQRRKRIFLVADFAGQCAGQVLFESESVSGYSPQGFRSWQGASRSSAPCAGAAGSLCLNDQGGNSINVSEDVSATLRAESHQHPPCVMEAAAFCPEESAKTRSIGYAEEQAPTLRAGLVPATVALDNHPKDGRIKIDGDVVQTLTKQMGTGGNNVPLLLKIRSGCEGGGKGPLIQEDKSATLSCNNDQTLFQPCAYGISSFCSNAMLSDNPHAGIYEAETARTLDVSGGNPSCNQGGICVVEGNGSRPSHIGDGFAESDTMYTLNTIERHGVAYAMTTGSFTQVSEECTPPLLARDFKDPMVVNDPVYGIGRDTMNQGKTAQFSPSFSENVQPTLVAKGPGGVIKGGPTYTVRRLTPTECARLQGFPDWWCADLGTETPSYGDIDFWSEVFETHRRIMGGSTKPKSQKQIIKWLQHPHSDAAEYKMWGNGVALPCVYFVLSGIVWCTQSKG